MPAPTGRTVHSAAPSRGEACDLIGKHRGVVDHRRHGEGNERFINPQKDSRKRKPRSEIKRGTEISSVYGADETRTRDLRCDSSLRPFQSGSVWCVLVGKPPNRRSGFHSV